MCTKGTKLGSSFQIPENSGMLEIRDSGQLFVERQAHLEKFSSRLQVNPPLESIGLTCDPHGISNFFPLDPRIQRLSVKWGWVYARVGKGRFCVHTLVGFVWGRVCFGECHGKELVSMEEHTLWHLVPKLLI